MSISCATRHTRMRALVYYIAVATTAFGGSLLASAIAGRSARAMDAWLLKTVVLALVALTTRIFLRRDGMGFDQYGVTYDGRILRSALVGLSGGIALALAWTAIVWIWAPFSLMVNQGFTLRMFLIGSMATLAMGLAEEIGYRTYGMGCLLIGFGPLVSVLAPSIIFAVAHTSGGMSWAAAVLVVGSCGILYGTLMLLTRSLPFVAAFHVGNNLLQDATLRTNAGSFWRPLFSFPDLAQKSSIAIWSSMAILNMGIAIVAWWRWRHLGSPLFDGQVDYLDRCSDYR